MVGIMVPFEALARDAMVGLERLGRGWVDP